ncbi:hypothetical protein ACHHYP_03975 [Achlya hypogyna]|uniref:Transmembrane protein 198 n=1 Tax=Achlya hypogyna TaxID=1202772 RepID=A0A1V9Z2E5_ACHHY|nr:hypothetical protein ACHHYP_03975 [Achlya hypogyna]
MRWYLPVLVLFSLLASIRGERFEGSGTVVANSSSPYPVAYSTQSIVNLSKYEEHDVDHETITTGNGVQSTPIVLSSGLLASSGISGIAVLPSIAAGASIGLGSVMLFYGYKLFRPSLFVSGFALGGMVAYMIAERVVAPTHSYFTAVCWICFAVVGLICAFLSIYMLGLGVFFAGAIGGLVLAFLLTTSFGFKWWPAYPEGILFIFGAVLSLIFGALAYSIEKPVLVVTLALTGAGAAVWGVGYFVGGYANADNLGVYRSTNATGAVEYTIPTSYWGYLGATIVLFILGAYVQFMNTACCENNDLYTWDEHAQVELEERRTYRERVGYPRYRDNYWARSRDNYYHAHHNC